MPILYILVRSSSQIEEHGLAGGWDRTVGQTRMSSELQRRLAEHSNLWGLVVGVRIPSKYGVDWIKPAGDCFRNWLLWARKRTFQLCKKVRNVVPNVVSQFIAPTKCTVLYLYEYYRRISDVFQYKCTVFREMVHFYRNMSQIRL